MTNEPLPQTISQLKQARNVLILVSNGGNLDHIAAGLALSQFLTKLDKQTTVISTTSLQPKAKILPEAELVGSGQQLTKNLVIEVGFEHAHLGELRYQKQEDKLSVFLVPKEGQFEPSDVSIKNAVYPFDLIVALGIASLEELGEFYAKHSQLFFETPVVNIDNSASNEVYGAVNLISLTSSAVTEIVFDLLQEYEPNFLDEKIATLLLTGLVSQTNSFQTVKTTPQAFDKASKLVSMGAKQQDIITQLYRSKSLGLLRLWGRVLARLKHDSQNQIAYSLVTASDIEKSTAAESDVDEIIYEMAQQLNFAKIHIFLAEKTEKQTEAYLFTAVPLNVPIVFAEYSPANLGGQNYRFRINKPVAEAESEVLAKIQAELHKS